MKLLSLVLLSALIVSCKGNANLYGTNINVNPVTPGDSNGGNNDGGDKGEEPNPRKPVVLDASNEFTYDDTTSASSWNTSLDLDGELTEKTKIRIIKTDPLTGEVLFAGDFLPGDDLSTAIPQNTEGSLDWAQDFAQYYAEGSILKDGGQLSFDKRSWAEGVSARYEDKNYFQNVITHDLGKAVEIETNYQVIEEGEVLSSTTTLEGIKYHYSYDNDAVYEMVSTDKKFGGLSFKTTLTVGGPTYIDSAFLDSENPKWVFEKLYFKKTPIETVCTALRLFKIQGELKRLLSIKVDGQWTDVDTIHKDMKDSIASVIGAKTFNNKGFPSSLDWNEPGVDCRDKIQLYFVSTPVDKSISTEVRLGLEKDSGLNASYIEILLAQYQSY